MIDKIIIGTNIKTRNEMFEFIASEFYKSGFVESATGFVEALHIREDQSTTGLIDGIAIPHGKSNQVLKSSIVYIKNESDIEWNSLDGKKVNCIFALSIKPDDSNHLNNLTKISTMLMKKENREKLKKLKDKNEIRRLFNNDFAK